MRRFSHERSECEKSHEVKIFLRTSFESYFIPREPNNHIKVMILRLEWYKHLCALRAVRGKNLKI